MQSLLPFDVAQGKPFDPFDVAQGKPFDPFDLAQGKLAQGKSK